MFRKMFPPLHFHPVFILFIFISILTGTFMELLIIFTIVFIHEMGHYFMAKAFKWRIRKVMLWVFGGVMETEEHGNRSIKEDVLVTIAGPIQHIFIYLLLYILLISGILNEAIFNTAISYNTVILIFNLLPIWPLDGGKLLFILMSVKYPYRKAMDAILLISMILSILFIVMHMFFYPFTLSFTLIMLFLFIENRLEWKRRFFIFLRFLLERYRGNNAVGKPEVLHLPGNISLMEAFSLFKREKKHTIAIKDQHTVHRIDETDCLHAYFHKKQYNRQIYDILNDS
ncbi:site-2 protease family protein [Oceanobacillus sp. FSL H7-0719]|uniref:site-2 protease family protein n=1 Tax=Oceanobacillus sp. FSL H7-0719 TaxID=2954507 RepID=UPI0032568B37